CKRGQLACPEGRQAGRVCNKTLSPLGGGRAMEPFIRLDGVAAALDRVNVDTDQIIPKQFLKRVERTGFGQFAFFDWRFLPNGELNPDFELNQPGYQGATILVAG